jgi:hypothetical protein
MSGNEIARTRAAYREQEESRGALLKGVNANEQVTLFS